MLINMSAENLFANLDRDEVDRLARHQGFRGRGPRTWSRHKGEFVQLVNLQRSQWSKDVSYLNFALWALVPGEPKAFAESKFLFRTRGEQMSVQDLPGFLEEADKLTSTSELAEALRTKRVSGWVRKELTALLP